MVQALGDLPFPPQDEEQGWASQGLFPLGPRTRVPQTVPTLGLFGVGGLAPPSHMFKARVSLSNDSSSLTVCSLGTVDTAGHSTQTIPQALVGQEGRAGRTANGAYG